MPKLQPQTVEWMDTAPIHVAVSRVMKANADSVFTVLADHVRWPEWFDGLNDVQVTGAPAGVGATRRVRVKGLGSLDEQFIAWEPGRSFGFTVVAMDRPVLKSLTELVTLEPEDDSVRVTYAQGFDPRRWSAPIFGLMAKRRIPKALAEALEGLERQVLASAR